MFNHYLAEFSISFFHFLPPIGLFGGHIRNLISFYFQMSWDPVKLQINSFCQIFLVTYFFPSELIILILVRTLFFITFFLIC